MSSPSTNLQWAMIGYAVAVVAVAGVVAAVTIAIVGFHCHYHHLPLDCYRYYY